MKTERIIIGCQLEDARVFLRRALESAGYQVATAANGRELLALVAQGPVDLVLCQVNLPPGGTLRIGVDIKRRRHVPVMAFGRVRDGKQVAELLAEAADDCLAHPFHTAELLARISALLRRWRLTETPAEPADSLTVGHLTLDREISRAAFGKQELGLSGKELDILMVLAQYVGKLVPRRLILELVWGADAREESKALDVHVSRMRRKLEDAVGVGDLVKTVRNRGYLLSSEIEDQALPDAELRGQA